MKTLFDEYQNIIMYIVFGLILVMSSYTIILNVHHYKALNSNIVVSELDSDYIKYKDNLNKIEELIKSKENIEGYQELNKALVLLKKDGVFRLLPKTKIGYSDLYNLNNYYIDELINNSWVSNIKNLKISEKYNDIINYTINSSRYLNEYLSKNGLVLYDNSNANKILNDYHILLSNYRMFSDVFYNIRTP